jgi:hypothetical protein
VHDGFTDGTTSIVRGVSLDGSLVVWDELDYIVVQLGYCLVEGGEPGSACSRELC